MTAKQLT